MGGEGSGAPSHELPGVGCLKVHGPLFVVQVPLSCFGEQIRALTESRPGAFVSVVHPGSEAS